MTWINKEELIERAYEEEKGMSKPYHNTFGVTVEWLADKTTNLTVRHGHWKDRLNIKTCSVCGRERESRDSWWNYCPACGARMNEEEE